MKQLTSRLPCFTFTHSRWRGDFSRRALAQSWAVALKAPSNRVTASSFVWFIVAFPLFAALSGGLDRDGFLWIVRRRIKGEQKRPPSLRRHIVAVRDALGNNDEVAGLSHAAVRAGRDDHRSF